MIEITKKTQVIYRYIYRDGYKPEQTALLCPGEFFLGLSRDEVGEPCIVVGIPVEDGSGE